MKHLFRPEIWVGEIGQGSNFSPFLAFQETTEATYSIEKQNNSPQISSDNQAVQWMKQPIGKYLGVIDNKKTFIRLATVANLNKAE
jgi:hypothetical protein